MSARKYSGIHGGGPTKRRHGARSLADLAGGAIEPALLRRAGLTVDLLSHWGEIAGPDLAGRSRPLRVKWGRRPHIGEAPAPGTLVVACDGATALRLQHMAEQVIDRVNATFGWRAIGRVVIEQRPIAPQEARTTAHDIAPERERHIERAAGTIEHERLRRALEGVGKAAARHEPVERRPA